MKTGSATPKHHPSNVVDFHGYIKRKNEEKFLSGERKPLYVSYSKGQVRGGNRSVTLSDFSEKIARLRSSLERISAELKKLPQKRR